MLLQQLLNVHLLVKSWSGKFDQISSAEDHFILRACSEENYYYKSKAYQVFSIDFWLTRPDHVFFTVGQWAKTRTWKQEPGNKIGQEWVIAYECPMKYLQCRYYNINMLKNDYIHQWFKKWNSTKCKRFL